MYNVNQKMSTVETYEELMEIKYDEIFYEDSLKQEIYK